MLSLERNAISAVIRSLPLPERRGKVAYLVQRGGVEDRSLETSEDTWDLHMRSLATFLLLEPRPQHQKVRLRSFIKYSGA
jgi:hypothetical protein